MRIVSLVLNSYIRYLTMNGYVTALAWLFALGSFLLGYIRVIRSLYRTPLQDANDAVRGARHNFDILKPVIIFLVSMSWIVTHL